METSGGFPVAADVLGCGGFGIRHKIIIGFEIRFDIIDVHYST